MSHPFPSPDWVRAFGEQINESPVYREAAAGWTYGAVALVTRAQPDIGLPHDVAIWLDLHEGTCRDAKMISGAEAEAAPFVITADYGPWKQVIKKELGPIAGIMQGKLKLKGSLAVIVRHVNVAEELVQCATRVPTKFLDE